MKKYSWSIHDDDGVWRNNTHDTIEDCIKDAKRVIADGDYQNPPKVVFIGENVEYVPSVDPIMILEHLEDEASEFVGELGYNWNAYNPKKWDELDELRESLSNIVIDWLNKYGYAPNFYAVQNVKMFVFEE